MVTFVQEKWTDFVGLSSHSVTSVNCQKRYFVNKMLLKKQRKVMAGAVPSIQPETKPTIAEEAWVNEMYV